MTAIECIAYEPLAPDSDLLKQLIEKMVSMELTPFYIHHEETSDPEQARSTTIYPDHSRKYGYATAHVYEGNPVEFANAVLANQRAYGSATPELTFYTKSKLKRFDHTVRFFTHLDGTRAILNYAATGGEDRAPTAQLLLRLAKELFRIFQPIHITIDFQYKSSPQSIKKSLRIRRIQELYWANLFDAEYVRTYGKDFFLNAPVYKAEELANGGFLIQLSSEIAPASKKALNIDEIAKYFQATGLKFISWPTNRYLKLPKPSSKEITA